MLVNVRLLVQLNVPKHLIDTHKQAKEDKLTVTLQDLFHHKKYT